MPISIKCNGQSTQHHWETFLGLMPLYTSKGRASRNKLCHLVSPNSFLSPLSCFVYLLISGTHFFIYFSMHSSNEKMICVLISALLVNDEKNTLTKENAFQSAHNVPCCSTGTERVWFNERR